MKPLVLAMRRRPDQRLDMSPLVPHRLAGMSAEMPAGGVIDRRRRELPAGAVLLLLWSGAGLAEGG